MNSVKTSTRKIYDSESLTTISRWGKVLSKFISFQVVLKALGMVITFGLVRVMSKDDYAYFTLATAMMGTITVLADSGVGSGLMAIGGKAYQDKHKLGQLVKTASILRRSLYLPSVIVVCSILAYLLADKGADSISISLILLFVAVGTYFQIETGVFSSVLLIRDKATQKQKMELLDTVIRFVLFSILLLFAFTASLAVLITTVGSVVVWMYAKRIIRQEIVADEVLNPKYRTSILSIVKHQMPNSIYFALSSQITIFLIGIFGNTASLAEIGALSRLALFFSIISITFNSLIAPYYSRLQENKRLLKKYFLILGAGMVFCSPLVLLSILFPNELLWILGGKYGHLRHELFLIIVNQMMGFVLGLSYSLNVSRCWVAPWYLLIPISLVSYILLISVFDLSLVSSVIMISILAKIPGYFLNFYVAYKGINTVENASGY